jgi:hypothetical protein
MYTMMSSTTLIYYIHSVVLNTGDNMLCMKMIKRAVDKAKAKAKAKKAVIS